MLGLGRVSITDFHLISASSGAPIRKRNVGKAEGKESPSFSAAIWLVSSGTLDLRYFYKRGFDGASRVWRAYASLGAVTFAFMPNQLLPLPYHAPRKVLCKKAHLAKRPSDLKQNGSKEKIPFTGTVFHTLSHGVLHFVASVSFKNH